MKNQFKVRNFVVISGKIQKERNDMHVSLEREIYRALSQWSVFVQVGINFLLFIFFSVMWFINRRKVLFSWSLAWGANLLAILLILSSLGRSYSGLGIFVIYFFYSLLKILFVYYILVGLYRFEMYNISLINERRTIFYILFFVFIFYPFFGRNPVSIQFITYTVVAVIFSFFGMLGLFRKRSLGFKIISLSLILYGFSFAHHSILLSNFFIGGKVPTYVGWLSFFDGFVEIVLGFSLMFALGYKIIYELRKVNAKLESNEELLRTLIDIDELTGLKNRRGLRNFIKSMRSKRGFVVFIDLDKFKKINDQWGHLIGDKCLKEVASSLQKVFRLEDGIFRYGGDEFLIITTLKKEILMKRLEKLRYLLKRSEVGFPVDISLGISQFGEIPFDEAIKIADEKMYLNKVMEEH